MDAGQTQTKFRFETPQNIDYVYVIHHQLDRIARLRTGLGQLLLDQPVVDPLQTVRHYLYAVETLHALLLPELRGNTGEQLDLAWRVLAIVSKIYANAEKAGNVPWDDEALDREIAELEMQIKQREKSTSSHKIAQSLANALKQNTYSLRERKKALEEIKRLRSELREILPDYVKKKLEARGQCRFGELVVWIADKALSTMLTSLKNAGLLMRGRYIPIGV